MFIKLYWSSIKQILQLSVFILNKKWSKKQNHVKFPNISTSIVQYNLNITYSQKNIYMYLQILSKSVNSHYVFVLNWTFLLIH